MEEPQDKGAGLSPAKRALLERRLEQLRAAREGGHTGPKPIPGNGPFPLSSAQQRLWLLDQLHPGLIAYNVGRVLRVRGPLDVDALGAAVSGVVRRHAALRTAFNIEDGTPVQRILAPEPVAVKQIDVRRAPDPVAAACALAHHELRAPFDLASGTLLRTMLIALAAEDHLLVLTVHHIVSDEGSKSIVFNDLARLYASALNGAEPRLAQPPIRYAEYAAWERERVAEAELNEQLDWWRDRLEGAPVDVDLPYDRSRPAVSAFAGARHLDEVRSETLGQLRALARSEGATLFMAMLAGFAALLARYSGQEDLVLGAPVSGRGGPGLDDVVGLFGNTIPLRVDVSGRPSFRELVRRARQTVISAFQHQDVPFERLVQDLADRSDLGRPPLTGVLFNFIEDPGADAPVLAGLDVTPVEIDPGVTKVDLGLVATVRHDTVRLLWEYSTELLEPETVAQLSRHLSRVLEVAAQTPDAPVETLPILTPDEMVLATGDLRATSAPIPRGTLHQLISAEAGAHPEAVAVSCDGDSQTYGELDRRADQVARHLIAAGIENGATVGIVMNRSVELPATVLGVLKAGCIYLPLDPAFPRPRIDYMLSDSGARAVLIGPGVELEPATAATIRLDEIGDRDPGAWSESGPDAPAYVIYTSGSTGQPKGVVVDHRNLVNLLTSMCRTPGIGGDDVLLAVTTLSFDIAGLELFAPLLAGGRVVICQDRIAADADALIALLSSVRPTVMQATPSTWRMLIDAGWQGDPRLRALCGGEALAPALAAELVHRVAELWNMYGPTETTIWSTCARITSPVTEVSIGRPIANTACYVLDPQDQPVPPGVPGQLCIGGGGVARGYHRRPELTAERFVPDPFAPGGRMYRTGDLVRRRRDGDLIFLGRNDDQVKLRGARIELGEIEATLARAPGVREIVVMLREDEPGDQRLVAYLTGDADVGAVKDVGREFLPAAMVPSVFVTLEQMPRTANRKLDRAALPRPSPRSGSAQDAPVGELEGRVAAVWCEVMGLAVLGRDDDFFALGGHSLTATRLAARLNAELGSRLPMRALFEAPTVARLALMADELAAQKSMADVPPPPLTRVPRSGHRIGQWAVEQPAELGSVLSAAARGEAELASDGEEELVVFEASYQQRRVWFLDRLDEQGALYSIPLCIAIDGALDPDLLQRSLDTLVARHEILRTTLAEHNGEPIQVVHPPFRFPLDYQHVDGEIDARRVSTEMARRRFDLARGPLVRGLLVRVDENRHVLTLVLHHAVADGWSLQLLIDELSALMRGEETAASSALAYGDYALWQRRWLSGAVLDAELAWWRATLAGAPADIELPTDRPRPTLPSYAGARHVVRLPGALLKALEKLAAAQGATLFMTLTAAVQALLVRYTDTDDVVVGVPVSGRARPELGEVAGYLANTLPVRSALDGDPRFVEALACVRQSVLDALTHQDVPLDRLVEDLAPDRDLSRNPLFQVLVMLQDDRPPVPDLPGAHTELVELDRGVSRFDLSLSFARRDGELHVAWEYSSELFDPSTVRRFAEHLRCLLQGVTANPQARLSQLPVLPADEQRAVLHELNDTARETPPRPVHELVAERAAGSPDAAAVICAGRSLSYRELDEGANRVARALVERGVGPGVVVGVRIDRSVDLIVAIHGVLRAGAAYIPLDPAYPADRVEFMLQDSGAPVLLTRSDLVGGFTLGATHVVCIDGPEVAERSIAPLAARAGLEDLAYVIYTSGSTGRPKGVMVRHLSLVNLLQSMSEHPGLRAGETMLGVTTPAFDLSVPDLYLPLVCGATLALATPEQALDPAALSALIRQQQPTVMQATPSTWRMLFEHGWTPDQPMRVVIGGEAVPVTVAERLRDVMEEAWNFYGPTETTVWSTCWRIAGELEGEVPIGHPIGNTSIYILDRHRNPLPMGVVGELYIGGAGVARGYLGRPELTAEKFLDDPFIPGGRMYRTGDLARLRPDGLLSFIGRRDHQIKLRGFRIELGEITTTLEQHEQITEAVAVVREDQPGDQRLVAYVVAGAPLDVGELLDHLRRTLPSYMIPGAIVALPELPLTPNGKLDRVRLPAPDQDARPAPTPPRTPVEEQLVEIWADVLRRDGLGVHDNLFHVGAHSLLVTRAVARIRQTMGVEIPLRRVYEDPTIAELAKHAVTAMLSREHEDDLESLLAELEATDTEVAGSA